MDDQRAKSDLVERLRATGFDRDNFPRMKQERWLPVGLAQEAADEIERLKAINDEQNQMIYIRDKEIERLRDYARHKFECAKIKDAVAKCDCGLDELLPTRAFKGNPGQDQREDG